MLIESATNIVLTLLNALVSALPQLSEGALQLVLTLAQGILDNLPQIAEAAIQVIVTLAAGLGEALPELIPSVVEAILLICSTLLDNMDQILAAAFSIIEGLAQGLLNALPRLVAALPQIITSIISFITNNLPKIVEMGIKLVVQFTIAQSGTYDLAVRLCFPFWDKNALRVTVDGQAKTFSESRLWWPYWRRTCWLSFAGGMSLSAGAHTLTIDGGVPGVQFYGFRVCSDFSESASAGEASFTLSPRQFLDVDGNPATPDKGFKLTCEMLRRKPDSALVWYEDFRDETPLPDSYWTTISGKWEVWRENYFDSRPYSLLEGSGRLAWKYEGFSDLHIRARLGFAPSGGGRAGVFVGNIFCCLNYDGTGCRWRLPPSAEGWAGSSGSWTAFSMP